MKDGEDSSDLLAGDPEFLMSRVRVDESGCWIWSGAKNAHGYGTVWFQKKSWLAHRLSYAANVGCVPAGKELDHLCRNRDCINPDHLEAVTHHENVLRGNAGKYLSDKTHCKRGHEFTGEKIDGRRICRPCMRLHTSNYRKRKMEKMK